jgi:N-acetylglutamate synthase
MTALHEALAATWPAARVERVAGFAIRDGAGGGGRASSATREEAAADPAAALAAMRERGIAPMFMVRDGEDALDAALEGLGLQRVKATVVYGGAAAALAYTAADVAVIDCEAPLARAAELWAEDGIGPARLAVMARVAGPKRYLLGRLDDRPAGAAFVAAHAGVAVASAILVAPWARRRGLGRRLVQGAAAWAAATGAERLALAVDAGNAPARALYEAMGMALAGRYHYRVGPEG